MKFRELKKVLERYGIDWDSRRGKGSHGAFVGDSYITKLRQVFTVPASQQREVSQVYIRPLRRRFELTAENGVSDEEFK